MSLLITSDSDLGGVNELKTSAANTFAFVTLELYPTTVGGVGILLHHTITALLIKGLRVVLYLDMNAEEIKNFRERDRHSYPNPHLLDFYDVRAMRGSIEFLDQLYTDTEQARSVAIAHALLKTQDAHSIDLIEFYDYCGPAYHYLSFNCTVRRPVAIRLHNTTEIIERGTRSAFNKSRLYTFAMERAQLIMADVLLSPGPRFFEEEILKIYGSEVKRQAVADAPPIHSSIGSVEYSVTTRKVLFYGRLSTFKGLDIFINGAVIALSDKSFFDWLDEFLIIGPEETVASALTLDEIKSVIPQTLAPKFRFVGRVDHARLMQVLEGVAFACFANRMESFCYAAHELYTAGIPLALSSRPAFLDHFTDEDVLFFGSSAKSLASAMLALAADPGKRERLSDRGKNKLQQDNAMLYLEFARIANEQLSARTGPISLQAEGNYLSVFILCNAVDQACDKTLASLSGAPVSVFVLKVDQEGEITFAGSRWSLSDRRDLLADVAPSCIFVHAGDFCHVDVLLEAAAHILEDNRIGAVAPWCEIDGRARSAVHAFIPEFASTLGPGLRTLIRVEADTTVVELLRSGSFSDETSLLLAQRAQSRGIVEKPIIGVTIDNNVQLPPARASAAIDYDRMSPAYLAFSSGLFPSASAGSRIPAIPFESSGSPYDLLSIRGIAAFGSGELWLLRVFRHRGAMHEPWSATQQYGEWALVTEAHSPAGGALKTYEGQLSFWADINYGIEFLFGPFCSGVEIRWRDSIYRISLKTEHVASSVVWLDHLVRGLFLPPVAEVLPVKPIGTSPLSEKTRSWIQLNMGPEIRALVLVQDSSSRPRENQDTVFCELGDLVDGPRVSPADLALALRAALACSIECVLHIPFGLPAAPALAESLLQGGHAGLVVDVDDDALTNFDQIIYRQLARWTGVLSSHRAGVTALGANEDILSSLERAGARIVRRKARLPRCVVNPINEQGEIDLVLLPSGGLVNNVAHMVVAGVFLAKRGIKVATMFLEAQHWHEGLVCESLGAARSYVCYQSLERVVAFRRNRRLIACAVYPDPMIPQQALKALSLGTPTLIGPIGASERYCDALGDMSVVHWEDSRDIGEALMNLIVRHDEILANYNRVASQLT